MHEPDLVNSNYFPVTAAILIEDCIKNCQESTPIFDRLTIMPDRAQGGTSKKHGQVELMINRSCVMQDNRGVFETYKN